MKLDILVLFAMQELKENELFKDSSNAVPKVPKEYKGYISSFGPSVIQSGLLPTIMFYENSKSTEKNGKKEILNILSGILKKTGKYKMTPNSLKELTMDKIKNKAEYADLVNDVLDAYTALKLSMRTFKFE